MQNLETPELGPYTIYKMLHQAQNVLAPATALTVAVGSDIVVVYHHLQYATPALVFNPRSCSSSAGAGPRIILELTATSILGSRALGRSSGIWPQNEQVVL